MNLVPLSFRVVGLWLLSSAGPHAVRAQEPPRVVFPAPSALGNVRQRIGVTEVEVEYSRPNKNGRQIFGSLVPFGEVWRTGANASTKISFADAVRLGGTEVPAGKYALYTIPTAGEWTVILSKDTSLWGAYKYKPSDDLLRLAVKPETIPTPTETFTIRFDEVKEDGATMSLAWDTLRVPVRITVDTNAKVMAAIARATAPGADPAPTPQLLAQSANYYLNHGGDLAQALGWVNMAIEKLPPSYALHERKARIQAKMGDKTGALASAQKALEMVKANPDDADPSTPGELQKFIDGLR